MVISSVRLHAIMLFLPFMLVLFFCDFAEARDDLEYALQQRSVLQSSEINLFEAQLELENWKHTQLEELHNNGFASWLELRRHELTVDTIELRLKTAREFKEFLLAAETEMQSVAGNDLEVFRDRESNPIKVFLPGSVRVIGWIEGHTLVESAQFKSDETAIKAAQEKLAKAQKRYDATSNPESGTTKWREKAALELGLAKRELEHVRAIENLQMPSSNAANLPSISIDDVENFVTAEQNEELKLATLTVAKAEATANGHVKSAQIMLEREQRRSEAFRQLHSQGHATAKELGVVSDRLARIKAQLEAFIKTQQTLKETSMEIGESSLEAAANYDSISNWPAVIFNDKEFALHLIDLRREYHNEKSIGEMAQLKSEFLQEVLVRLKAAALHAKPNSKFGSVLTEGQRNEIESYESDIEFAKASNVATIEKRQILVHEENRFIKQTIAQYQAARDKLVGSDKNSFNALGMLCLIHPTAAVASSGRPGALTHFSYLESGNLNDVGRSSSLLFTQSRLNYLGTPYGINSVNRFSLTPVESSLMVSDSRRSYPSSGRLKLEPDWMHYSQRNLSRNSYSTFRYLHQPYYDISSYRNYYGHYGSPPFGNYYAYPYGILRADLRSRITPGQIPWYIPGRPTNIRSNQLYYRHGKNYHRR